METQLLLDPAPDTSLPGNGSSSRKKPAEPFACSRDFLENQFVYLTVSSRARGLAIEINVNPDRKCNFDCAYCEIDRSRPTTNTVLDCDVAARELEHLLSMVHNGDLRRLPPYDSYPSELLKLQQVALSGDGEPTASPKFLEIVEAVVHIRALGHFPFFKIVLVTNASFLDFAEVQSGLKLLISRDEVWAKLDIGTQQFMDTVNRTGISLQKIIDNILLTARRRPVIIQSLFCQINGKVPTNAEILEFALRLHELKEKGAQIPLVQIYSATPPAHRPYIHHLPLKTLSEIAATVRGVSALHAEPF